MYAEDTYVFCSYNLVGCITVRFKLFALREASRCRTKFVLVSTMDAALSSTARRAERPLLWPGVGDLLLYSDLPLLLLCVVSRVVLLRRVILWIFGKLL